MDDELIQLVWKAAGGTQHLPERSELNFRTRLRVVTLNNENQP
jgi:hypothetical protein